MRTEWVCVNVSAGMHSVHASQECDGVKVWACSDNHWYVH